MDAPRTPAEKYAAACLADRLEMLGRLTPEQIERRADAIEADAYREEVRKSGDRAEWAAIDGMSDAFVAAVARGDTDAMNREAGR